MQIISLLPYHLQIKILYISCNCKMSCALRQQNGSKLHNYKLLTTTNYFVNPSLWWPIYVFNSVVNTKLLTNYLAGEDLPLWCFHSRLSSPYNHSKWTNLQIVYLFESVCCRPQTCLPICRENYSPAGNQQQYPHLSPPSPPPLLALMISVWKILPLLRCSKRVDTAWKSLGYVQFLLFFEVHWAS